MKKAEFEKAKVRLNGYIEKYGYSTDTVISFVTACAGEENERTWTDSQLKELFDMADNANKKVLTTDQSSQDLRKKQIGKTSISILTEMEGKSR